MLSFSTKKLRDFEILDKSFEFITIFGFFSTLYLPSCKKKIDYVHLLWTCSYHSNFIFSGSSITINYLSLRFKLFLF